MFFLYLIVLFCTYTLASYPEYQEFSGASFKGEGSYIHFASKINKTKIKTIFEIGSRDGKDALELSKFFKCHVFAFECNPIAIELCKSNIGLNPNVTLVPMGVWDTTGEMFFYSIKEGNIGASSFFQFNTKARNYPDIVEEGLIQEKITVHSVRLDEFLKAHEIENIDLLCMDVQGAAYEVLCSLGEQLSKVKYIIVELETHPIYAGEVLYQDVDNYLLAAGFVKGSQPLEANGLFGDIFYINSRYMTRSKLHKHRKRN